MAKLNKLTEQRTSPIFLPTFRDQTNANVYKLPNNVLHNYNSLKNALNQRSGHTELKDNYIAEVKLRRKKNIETFRDLGQAKHLPIVIIGNTCRKIL